jgi:proteasome accessory factor C
VVLDLHRGARWVAEYYPVESATERPDGVLRVEMFAADPRWVTRLALRLGGSVSVVAPSWLAEDAVVSARAALARYDLPELS